MNLSKMAIGQTVTKVAAGYKNEDDFIDSRGGNVKELDDIISAAFRFGTAADPRVYKEFIKQLPYDVDPRDPVVVKFFKDHAASNLSRPYDIPDASAAKQFSQFVAALTKLSKATGVFVNVTGGVHIVLPKNIQAVQYTNDYSSGDLQATVTLVDGHKL